MKNKILALTVVSLFMVSVGAAQVGENGQLNAKQDANAINIALGEISDTASNFLSLTTGTEEFVQGEQIDLTADQLYITVDGWGECRTGEVWLQIRNPDNNVVQEENLGQWTCLSDQPIYEYSTNYVIPEDIGDQSGFYTFRMYFADDYSGTNLCGSNPYGDNYKPESCTAQVGNIQQLQKSITVSDDTENLPPTVDLEAPLYANQDQDVRFEAKVSDDVVNCKWSFEGVDDVSYDDSGANLAVVRSWGGLFDASGNKDVSLTCKDRVGQEDSDSHTISISEKSNEPPIVRATAEPSTVEVGEPVTFSAKQSSDLDGTVESCEWSNGKVSKEFQTSFSSAGEESLSVTCTDNDGDTDSETVSVTVESGVEPVNRYVFDGEQCVEETFQPDSVPEYSFESKAECEAYGKTGLNPVLLGLIGIGFILMFLFGVVIYVRR